jgi:hypothetical protein
MDMWVLLCVKTLVSWGESYTMARRCTAGVWLPSIVAKLKNVGWVEVKGVLCFTPKPIIDPHERC